MFAFCVLNPASSLTDRPPLARRPSHKFSSTRLAKLLFIYERHNLSLAAALLSHVGTSLFTNKTLKTGIAYHFWDIERAEQEVQTGGNGVHRAAGDRHGLGNLVEETPMGSTANEREWTQMQPGTAGSVSKLQRSDMFIVTRSRKSPKLR